jgi:uncharacterized membrane protein YeaQ/YmgE (transglycosylase-associated protein family)
MLFHLIGFIVFGLIVGLIARALTPGAQHMSILKTAFLGIIGAEIAGWAGRLLGLYGPVDRAGFIMSVLGAVVLLMGYHSYQTRKAQAKMPGGERKDQQYPRRVA